jgi:endonuclease-3
MSATPSEKAREIFRLLKKQHPDAHIELRFSHPLELLVATVLSAQCTDVRVNIVTEQLFKKYRRPADYLAVPVAELEDDIRSTGFFRNKAKAIRGQMEAILARHGGEVPRTIEDLVQLPGVGRKTANVILGNAFGVPGVVVDTHVRRVSQRIGLTKNDDPEKIEADLMALYPPKDWTLLSHVFIFHGRRICAARKPACDRCPITKWCDYFATLPRS